MTEGQPAKTNNSLNTRASGVIALAVSLSRVLGLVREVTFNALLGTSSMGLFIVAFRVPNLLRDLFAEGALSTAFITVFSQKIQKEGENSAWELAAKMVTLAVVFMSAVTLLGVVFSDAVIDLLAGGFKPENREMTVLLTRIMFPFILLVSISALVMGMLNSRNVFGIPALASSFFNLGSIGGGLFIGWKIDPDFGREALIGLAVGTLIGGLLQLLVQLPSLRRVGFRFRPDFRWRDPGVRRVLVLMIPSVIAASAVQINVMVNTGFATHLGSSAVTWLNSAFRLMQLPLGIFGVAVATITLPVVSRIAAQKDTSHFGPTLGRAMRLVLFLTLPSAVGLYLLAHPIVTLIFERMAFTAADSFQTSLTLQFYALGLVAYAGVKVLSPSFYAIDKKWTPMFVSFGSIGLNFGLNYLFIFHFKLGAKGLALSTSLSAAANFLVLYLLMNRNVTTLESGRLGGTALRCLLAVSAMGVVCFLGLQYGAAWLQAPHFWLRAVTLLALIGLAAATYLAVCFLLRVEEVHEAGRLVARKVLRRSGKL